ncbi:MAG: hypothetical protein AAB288_06975, partial [Acidobacteriota bacterium]
MKAIIWKELRENYKYVALLAIGLWVAIGLGFYYQPLYLMVHSLPSIMVIGPAAVGLILGLLQSISESQRDRWAFLIHRPLSPATIFLGKVIAGICLYLFIASTTFMYHPFLNFFGRLIGDHEGIVLLKLVIADVLTGIVYYFAGILAGFAGGRWYGSRWLGIATAIFCSNLVLAAVELWQALVAIAFFGFILWIAAYGSFLARESRHLMPRWAKICLGTVFFLGIVFIGGIAGRAVVSDGY